jgi:hypothetical protein
LLEQQTTKLDPLVLAANLHPAKETGEASEKLMDGMNADSTHHVCDDLPAGAVSGRNPPSSPVAVSLYKRGKANSEQTLGAASRLTVSYRYL